MDVVEGVDGGADTADLPPAGGADVRGLGARRGSGGGGARHGAGYGAGSVLVRGGRGGAGRAGVGVEDDEASAALELGQREHEVGVAGAARVGASSLVV